MEGRESLFNKVFSANLHKTCHSLWMSTFLSLAVWQLTFGRLFSRFQERTAAASSACCFSLLMTLSQIHSANMSPNDVYEVARFSFLLFGDMCATKSAEAESSNVYKILNSSSNKWAGWMESFLFYDIQKGNHHVVPLGRLDIWGSHFHLHRLNVSPHRIRILIAATTTDPAADHPFFVYLVTTDNEPSFIVSHQPRQCLRESRFVATFCSKNKINVFINTGRVSQPWCHQWLVAVSGSRMTPSPTPSLVSTTTRSGRVMKLMFHIKALISTQTRVIKFRLSWPFRVLYLPSDCRIKVKCAWFTSAWSARFCVRWRYRWWLLLALLL